MFIIYLSAFSLAPPPRVFCTEAPLYALWLGQIGVSEELFSIVLVKGKAGTFAILLSKVCTFFFLPKWVVASCELVKCDETSYYSLITYFIDFK